jgi:hypothetical protein
MKTTSYKGCEIRDYGYRAEVRLPSCPTFVQMVKSAAEAKRWVNAYLARHGFKTLA